MYLGFICNKIGGCPMQQKKTINASSFEYSHTSDKNRNYSLNTRHCHDTYEILYVTDGRGRYLIEGAEFELRPRTLVLIRPFEYHCVEIDDDADYVRCVLHFPESYVVKEARTIFDTLKGGSEDDSGCFYSPEVLDDSVVSVFDRFEIAERLPESEKQLYCRLLLSELITLLAVAARERIVHTEDDLGARVARYINASLCRNISLEVLARKFFVSKYYLCRAFKKHSGVSIHAYVNHKMVMYAKQLIDSGETASGAAYKVGFGDYSAFYRAYVKVIGNPPTHKE